MDGTTSGEKIRQPKYRKSHRKTLQLETGFPPKVLLARRFPARATARVKTSPKGARHQLEVGWHPHLGSSQVLPGQPTGERVRLEGLELLGKMPSCGDTCCPT